MRARTSKDERERRHREGEHDVIVERRLRTSGHPAANTDVTVERRARSWDLQGVMHSFRADFEGHRKVALRGKVVSSQGEIIGTRTSSQGASSQGEIIAR